MLDASDKAASIAFNLKAGRMYARANFGSLGVFDFKGIKLAEYSLPFRLFGEKLQGAPDGRSMLIVVGIGSRKITRYILRLDVNGSPIVAR